MDVGDQVWESVAYLSSSTMQPVAHVYRVTYCGPAREPLEFLGPLVEMAGGERRRVGIGSLHATEAEAKLAAADKLQAEADKIVAVVDRLRAEAGVAAVEVASV